MRAVQLTILAFAQAHDRLGFRERVVECAPHDTPRAIVARVAPGVSLDDVRVAIDQEYAAWDAPVGEARELALIPPVSGG